MAQVRITIECEGCKKNFVHTHTCMNRTAAESYTEWANDHITVCPECYKARQIAIKKAQAVKEAKRSVMRRAWQIAREGVEKFGGKCREFFSEALRIAWAEAKAAMTGTEKQIAWAKDIRAKFQQQITAYGLNEQACKLFNSAPTEAKWWIDNRDLSLTALFKLLVG